jgi:hypothetical protein
MFTRSTVVAVLTIAACVTANPRTPAAPTPMVTSGCAPVGDSAIQVVAESAEFAQLAWAIASRRVSDSVGAHAYINLTFPPETGRRSFGGSRPVMLIPFRDRE